MTLPIKDILVFDSAQIKRNKDRCRNQFKNHDFLFQWAAREIADRLNDINRSFKSSLQIGSRASLLGHPKISSIVTMDITETPVVPCPAFISAIDDFFPFKAQSFDLVTSVLNLHTVNDLPGSLIQIRQSLMPDGLFLAAMFGGETLRELRQVMTQAELNISGGISPRVAPFADKPQMGGLLQRAGFALPVVDSELITVTYPSFFKLLHDLRGMGEGNAIAARQKSPSTRALFFEAARLYQDNFSDKDGRLNATFEIIFLLGWAPHSSQQKPLKPGSAKTSLADALGGIEFSTGEKTAP